MVASIEKSGHLKFALSAVSTAGPGLQKVRVGVRYPRVIGSKAIHLQKRRAAEAL